MSIFLELLEDSLPVISPLLMEVLLRELPLCVDKGMSDEETLQYVVSVYRTVMGKAITAEDARSIVMHLLKGSEQPASEAEVVVSNKQTFGSGFFDYLSAMELDDCCLVLSGYDIEKATTMYRHMDYRMVKAMRKTWQDIEAHKARLSLEATVYGFGGGFGSSEGGEADEHYDLRTDDMNAADLNALLNTWH